MTLEEKAAQLGSRWVGNAMSTEPADQNVAPMQDVFAAGAATPLAEASRHGLGHLTRVYGSRPLTPAEGAAELVREQRTVIDGSRLAIPAIVHEECLTGFTAYGATVYPAAIAWGAAFDPDLVERMAAAIGRDMAAVGVHQGLAPVVDVVRDYRWGRVEETIGEDPYLVGMLGGAYVRGLLDVILPTFEMAVVRDGVGSVMNSYSDVDGVPAAADTWLLTDVLRGDWAL